MKQLTFSRRRMLRFTGAAALAGLFAPAVSFLPQARAAEAKKPLIVYFSMPETDNPLHMTREEENSTVVVNGKVLGNTQYVAMLIRQKTGGSLFRLEPVTPYPREHRALVSLAEKEQAGNRRPEIAGAPGLTASDTIFLGYPNWWADMPMILYTFLEQQDLSGKTIIPFCTHGGSGFSRTIQTIQEKQPGARVQKAGFAVYRQNMEAAPAGVTAWLRKTGYGLQLQSCRRGRAEQETGNFPGYADRA